MKIDIQKLSYSYKDELVLKDFSFCFLPGKIYSIVGVSGCGKSTLLNIIAGHLDYQEGRIYYSPDILKERVGYMTQKDILLPFYTIYQNLLVVCKAQGIKKDLANKKINSLLSEWGLEKYIHKYPFQLSGGLIKRINIIRQCLIKTSLILLDEPFAALDFVSKNYAQEFLLKHIQQNGQTVILVTHDFKEACFFSNYILLLGGTPTQLIKVFDTKGFNTKEEITILESSIVEVLKQSYNSNYSFYK